MSGGPVARLLDPGVGRIGRATTGLRLGPGSTGAVSAGA